MSHPDEKEVTSAHKQHLGGVDLVPSQRRNKEVIGNGPRTLDVALSSLSTAGTNLGNPELLASRVDVGDPDPKKEIQRFLLLPYLLAEHVLKLARANRAFHLMGVIIARQALRLVLVLNAEVAKDGPNRAQLNERVRLQELAPFPATIIISQLIIDT
jgi:hypothetical protein